MRDFFPYLHSRTGKGWGNYSPNWLLPLSPPQMSPVLTHPGSGVSLPQSSGGRGAQEREKRMGGGVHLSRRGIVICFMDLKSACTGVGGAEGAGSPKVWVAGLTLPFRKSWIFPCRCLFALWLPTISHHPG